MHNKDKYPAIWDEFQRARKALEPLMQKRKKYTDQIDEIGVEIGALIEKKKQINDLAMADIEQISELRAEVARLARAMGAKSI